MTRPTCEDCGHPADLTVADPGKGYQTYAPATTDLCHACLKARQDAEADEPWPIWDDPRVIARHTDPTPPKETTMPDTPTLSDRLAPIVAELVDIAEQKADLETREKDLKAQIRNLVPGADTYDAAGVTVVVAHNRRFNEKKALPLIPEALTAVVTYPETRIDKDKLRALLPDVYEAAQDVYDDRVSIK